MPTYAKFWSSNARFAHYISLDLDFFSFKFFKFVKYYKGKKQKRIDTTLMVVLEKKNY